MTRLMILFHGMMVKVQINCQLAFRISLVFLEYVHVNFFGEYIYRERSILISSDDHSLTEVYCDMYWDRELNIKIKIELKLNMDNEKWEVNIILATKKNNAEYLISHIILS